MFDEPKCAVISTAVAGEKEGEELARQLVDRNLAACVQMIPVRSVYRWKNAVQFDNECLLLAKTALNRVPALQTFIREQHPYELPEIIVTPVTGGLAEYLDWICDETRVAPDSEQ
ncbi:MAG: divalent-cation tolerance protein CutA [Kiritimatiellia bacterium]